MQQQDNFLSVQETMPSVTFDKERLFSWVNQIIAQYENLAVTESDIRSAKEVMALLNKQAKALDDARKETVKRVSAPIKSFEADIKEAHQKILNARSLIAQQVAIFDEKLRSEKRIIVQKMIDEMTARYDGLEIAMNEKWLNKSVHVSIVKNEISCLVKEHEELVRQQLATEQSIKGRVAFIEELVMRLNREFGFNYSVSTFFHSRYMDSAHMSLELIKKEIENTFKAESRKLHENKEQSLVMNNMTTLQITFTTREETVEKIRNFFREIRPELIHLEARRLD